MHVWSSIGGAVCVAATAAGFVLTWLTWRKSGATRGMRVLAWALLPLAAYLTGAVGLLGRLVSAIVSFAGSFVFSPKSWAGVVVVGLAAALFLVSGGLPLLGWRKSRARRREAKDARAAGDGQAAVARTDGTRAAVPAARRKARVPDTPDDDDMGDVQEILRRRGIK